MHTVATHPLVLARQIATIDEIGRGRAGLNIVAGWNDPEYRALGLRLPKDHETRYAYAQEWFEIVERLWSSSKPFDYNGKFFQLEGAYRSEEHTSELQSLMRISYAVFCLKKKKKEKRIHTQHIKHNTTHNKDIRDNIIYR